LPFGPVACVNKIEIMKSKLFLLKKKFVDNFIREKVTQNV